MLTPAEIKLEELPALPLGARGTLPACAAIYFALSDKDEVLYIGRAALLSARWVGHHRVHELERLGAVRIAWLAVSDAALLPALEDACIAHFQPRLNGTVVAEGSKRTDVRVMLSLRPDVARELRTAANDEGLPVATLARRCVLLYLRQRRADQLAREATNGRGRQESARAATQECAE